MFQVQPVQPQAVVKKSPITNLDFFETYCRYEMEDMRTIQRMVNAMFAKRGVADRPVWEREDCLDKWLHEPFDMAAWDRAKIQTLNNI